MTAATQTLMMAEAQASPDKFTSEHIETALLLAAEKITPKRMKFIKNYVANGFNAADAYRAAGYKGNKNVVRVSAFKVLADPRIANYLMWKIRQITLQEDTQIDEGKLIRESNALAYASITDLAEWDADGKVHIKPSSEIPREVAAAIKKIKCTTKVTPVEDGEPIETHTLEVEMHDKKGALDLQARISGILRDVKVNDYSNYTLNMYFGDPPKQEKNVGPG